MISSIKRYSIIFILTASILNGGEFYIYNIGNKCQAVFPEKPSTRIKVGRTIYEYYDNSNNIYYIARQDKNPYNLNDLKKDDKQAMKQVMDMTSHKLIYMNSKVVSNNYIYEYQDEGLEMGFDVTNFTFNFMEVGAWCVWNVKAMNKSSVKKAKNIFDKYKNNIKFR